MMDSMDFYNVMVSLVSCLGILYLVFWAYKDYRLNAFRQEMFALRAKLFDYAADGNIDFDDPAYGKLRTTMNGFIRFGHKLSFWQFLFFGLALEKDEKEFMNEAKTKWDAPFHALPDSQKNELKEYFEKMNFLVVKHVVILSPECMILVFPPLLSFVFYKVFSAKLKSFCKSIINSNVGLKVLEMDEAAYAVGRRIPAV